MSYVIVDIFIVGEKEVAIEDLEAVQKDAESLCQDFDGGLITTDETGDSMFFCAFGDYDEICASVMKKLQKYSFVSFDVTEGEWAIFDEFEFAALKQAYENGEINHIHFDPNGGGIVHMGDLAPLKEQAELLLSIIEKN